MSDLQSVKVTQTNHHWTFGCLCSKSQRIQIIASFVVYKFLKASGDGVLHIFHAVCVFCKRLDDDGDVLRIFLSICVFCKRMDDDGDVLRIFLSICVFCKRLDDDGDVLCIFLSICVFCNDGLRGRKKDNNLSNGKCNNSFCYHPHLLLWLHKSMN